MTAEVGDDGAPWRNVAGVPVITNGNPRRRPGGRHAGPRRVPEPDRGAPADRRAGARRAAEPTPSRTEPAGDHHPDRDHRRHRRVLHRPRPASESRRRPTARPGRRRPTTRRRLPTRPRHRAAERLPAPSLRPSPGTSGRDPRPDGPTMTDEPVPGRGRVAFLGLGTMGAAMAANLARAGFPVTAWNRTPGRGAELAELGVDARRLAGRRGHAEPTSSVVCVSDTPDVEAVLFGPDGVVAGAAPGTLVIDCSTIAPSGELGLRGPARRARHPAGRRAGLGRQRGRPERDADDLRRRRRRRRRAGAARPRGDGPDDHPRRARSAPARRSRPSTRSSSPAPTSASPRASSSPSRPASTSSRWSSALGGGAAQSWVLANRSGRMIDNDYPLGFKSRSIART